MGISCCQNLEITILRRIKMHKICLYELKKARMMMNQCYHILSIHKFEFDASAYYH